MTHVEITIRVPQVMADNIQGHADAVGQDLAEVTAFLVSYGLAVLDDTQLLSKARHPANPRNVFKLLREVPDVPDGNAS